MKLVDLDTKITVQLYDDEREEVVEREMSVGEYIDSFSVEGLLQTPIFNIPDDIPELHNLLYALREE